jgi:hypothetical protein
MAAVRWPNPAEEGQLQPPEPAKRSQGRGREAMMWFGGGEKHRGGDARSSGSPFCGQGCVDRGGKGKGGPVRWRTERGGGVRA